jgi:sigma-B regulation protein RsbU (phosphoserine phosphatase)
LSIGGETVSGNAIWPTWTGDDDGLLSKPWVIWFRMVSNLVDLESGEPIEDGRSVALLRTSPKNVWDDFTLSEYELRAELWGVLAGLGILFLLGYGLVLAAAAAVVVSIARSTARLSKGAREVEQGHLDYRVPVKRRDQLGDLAMSFNHMTDSVQSMLADVAEKERLASELELAREIQESLLPARFLEVGPLTVRATFQPAAEVGGDYYDVFSVSNERMVVAIGDVAGHGLSTGLLMASLKSSVAALVREGYAGSELLQKVNLVLTENRPDRTMVTLSVIDVDLARDRVSIANAGHPPAFLIGADGAVDELMISSLPLGTRLCRPASIERAFPIDARLLLYSDGLVEALSDAGDPFGYERLQQTIEDAVESAASDLIERLHKALRLHAGETPPADDLTLLIIERNG